VGARSDQQTFLVQSVLDAFLGGSPHSVRAGLKLSCGILDIFVFGLVGRVVRAAIGVKLIYPFLQAVVIGNEAGKSWISRNFQRDPVIETCNVADILWRRGQAWIVRFIDISGRPVGILGQFFGRKPVRSRD
jgi:hypothetical protein